MQLSDAEKVLVVEGWLTRLAGGKLQIVNGQATVLWLATLNSPAGTRANLTLTLAGFPKAAAALAAATLQAPPTQAVLLRADNTLVGTLSVGASGSGADVQLSALVWAADETVRVLANPTIGLQ